MWSYGVPILSNMQAGINATGQQQKLGLPSQGTTVIGDRSYLTVHITIHDKSNVIGMMVTFVSLSNLGLGAILSYFKNFAKNIFFQYIYFSMDLTSAQCTLSINMPLMGSYKKQFERFCISKPRIRNSKWHIMPLLLMSYLHLKLNGVSCFRRQIPQNSRCYIVIRPVTIYTCPYACFSPVGFANHIRYAGCLNQSWLPQNCNGQ